MTIKELYEYAKENHCQNAIINISYKCDDRYYSFEKQLHKEQVSFFNSEMYLDIIYLDI